MNNIFSTFIDDMRAFKTMLKIAFTSYERNPIHLAMEEKRHREELKNAKIDETYRNLLKEYRDTLVKDGEEEDEISENLLFKDHYLRTKAKILNYDFEAENRDERTDIEKEVDFADSRMFDFGFCRRMFAYAVIIGSILAVSLIGLRFLIA